MAGLGTLAGLAGCANDLPLAGANTSEANSVFSLFAPPSPVEAAAMAVNEYSADERQSGTLLLANAPWGNSEVYVRLYRLNLEDEDAAVRTAADGDSLTPRRSPPVCSTTSSFRTLLRRSPRVCSPIVKPKWSRRWLVGSRTPRSAENSMYRSAP